MSFTDLLAFNLSAIKVNNDQAKTNFCHSFASTIGLRRALAILMEGKTSREVFYGPQSSFEENSRQSVPLVVKGGKSVDEILRDQSHWQESKRYNGYSENSRYFTSYNICSTNSFLSNLIGNVNVRSFAGLDGDYAKASALGKQVAQLDRLLGRLTSPTLFEVAGWKRILGVVKMFEAFSSDDEILNPEDYELVARKVSHPNSIGIETFQNEMIKAADLNENDREKVHTKIKKPWFKPEESNFIVSP